LSKNWIRNQIRKQYKRDKLDENYKFPMCHKCEECEFMKERHTDICKILNRDVGQSVFGRNSPKCCPKRDSNSKELNK
jgi:hypothetical protein